MPVRSASWRAVRVFSSAENVSIRARTRRAPSQPCAALASGGILTAEALAIAPSLVVRTFLSMNDNDVSRIRSTESRNASRIRERRPDSGMPAGPGNASRNSGTPARRDQQASTDDQGGERHQREQRYPQASGHTRQPGHLAASPTHRPAPSTPA